MFTVDNIMDLMINNDYSLRFYVNGRTFEFTENDIPDDLKYMIVESIDDPYYQSNIPLCLNISEENFDDFNAFEEEFSEYLVD